MAKLYHFNGETVDVEPQPRAYVLVRAYGKRYELIARVNSLAACHVLYRSLANMDASGDFHYFPADEWDTRNRRKCELCGEVWDGQGRDCETCQPVAALAMAKGKAGDYSRSIFASVP